MTQASETPEQKRDEKQGSSRRSAASAKPATQAAASVYTPKRTAKAKEPKKPFEGLKKKLTEEQKPKTKAEKRARQEALEQQAFYEGARNHVPTTAKYKRLRYLFWATILLAIAFTLYALFLIATQGPTEGRIWFGVGSLLVALAIFIDSSKVRQEREADYQRLLDEQNNKKKKPAASAAEEPAGQRDAQAAAAGSSSSSQQKAASGEGPSGDGASADPAVPRSDAQAADQ